MSVSSSGFRVDQTVYSSMQAVEARHWWFLARRRIVLDLLAAELPRGRRVLDVGCGTGFILASLAERYDAWGLDPADAAIEACRARGLHRVVQRSATDLDFAGATFDAVLFLDVLEHLEDDLAAARAAATVLAPGGFVLATVPAHRFLWSEHDVLHHHHRRYARTELRRLLESAGLRVERLTYYNTLLFPVALLRRAAARFGTDLARDLEPPRPWLNALLRSVFESERHWLAGRGGAFPTGLSLLAVARKPAGSA